VIQQNIACLLHFLWGFQAARKFLDEEAEVSDDDDVMSADDCDNDSDLDCMESSFINDDTQLTQAEPTAG
jgi:hypothetical protein